MGKYYFLYLLRNEVDRMNTSDYIVPLFATCEKESPLNHSIKINELCFVGNGFFLENYFITAAHVIREGIDHYFEWKNRRVELKDLELVEIRELEYDESGNPYGHHGYDKGDVAIFKFEGVHSPFRLSNTTPQPGMSFHCDFYHKKQYPKEEGHTNSFFWRTEGHLVIEDDDPAENFFGMYMNPVHPEGGGSSGSPLYEENIVYGILHGGGPIEHPEVCVFNSASFIRRLLHYQDR